MISYFQAILIALLQGVTELFPVSSLGHSVLVPAWFGWHGVVGQQAADESPYLAFLVGLHVATALALVAFFRAEWVRIAGALVRSARERRIDGADERLAWLLVAGTVPAGLVGVVFEHPLRTLFAKPLAAALFLTANGLILLGGERLRGRATARGARPAGLAAPRLQPTVGTVQQIAAPPPIATRARRTAGASAPRLSTLAFGEAALIGSAQILAFFAGISRSGVTMVGGLLRGLDHEDAARFAFLLATPIILAAGVYKLPELLGPEGAGIRGQLLLGSIVAGGASYLSVRFLTRWFTTRTLFPFAIYCLVAGLLSVVRFA